jgi:hypothetical protein
MSRILPMRADLEPQICEDLIVDLRRLLVQSIRESPTDPSSVRVTVGNDGSAPARYSDEVFVHARMLSGHHRQRLRVRLRGRWAILEWIAQAVFADRQSDPRRSVVRDPRA